VVVTPTFAAGLGVVIAAVLAYPMGTVVFRYISPGSNGQACPAPGCGPVGGRAPGSLASAAPGTRLATGAPQTLGGQRAPQGSPTGSGGTGGSGGPGESSWQPVLTYQTVRRGPRGFTGVIAVSFPSGHAPQRWSLRFSYPVRHIRAAWTARWRMDVQGGHLVVVEFHDTGGPVPRRSAVRVWFGVSGKAGPPPVCAIDGTACHLTTEQQAHMAWRHGAHGHRDAAAGGPPGRRWAG
jgi:hypothetical protein